MSIQKVVPVVSNNKSGLAGEPDPHDVPFDGMSVNVYHEGALIREAAAQYWQPKYDTTLSQILWNVIPQGLLQCYGRDSDYNFPVEVRILITYPLNEWWEARVKIPANRIGEIFAITYDMYKHIYDLDDQNWQAEGHQDETPRAAPKCLNRARGKHVWGHDMSDLVFEGVNFYLNPKWPTEDREVIDKQHLQTLIDGQPPEMKSAPEMLDKDKHADACPYLGAFTFFIGS